MPRSFPSRSSSISSKSSGSASHLDASPSGLRASTRSRRAPSREYKPVTKYPYGPPDPSDPLEVLYASLDFAKISARALVAADDLIVRIFDVPRLRLRARSFAKTTCEQTRRNFSDFKRSFHSAFSKSVDLDRTAKQFTRRMQSLDLVEKDEESGLAFSNLSVRYAQLKYRSSHVTLSDVDLDKKLQFRIIASSCILKGTVILELGGLMSTDAVLMPDSVDQGSKKRKREESPQYDMFSIIWKDSRQCGPTSTSDRLLLGPARFINHSCEPNCKLKPIPRTYAWVMETTKDVLAGEEITINYGKNYFSPGECACTRCLGRIDPSAEAGTDPLITRTAYPTPPAEPAECSRPRKRAREKC